MSVDFKLDPAHDLSIENFDLVVISNVDQVIQNIDIRLKFFLGEWFLDIGKGLPYYSNVLKKDFDVGLLESSFKAQITGTPGVESLSEFDLALQGIRTLVVTFKVVVLDEEVSGEIIL